jgi:hypothetical protein
MTRLLLGALFMLCAFAAAAAPERLLVYKVERIAPADAPCVDGDLSEPVWRDKAAITALRNFLGPLAGELPTQGSEFVLLTDGATLFIGATFHEQDMPSVRFNPGAEPFWNDCIELYFDPAHNGSRHIQLVVDCGGRKWWHKQYDEGYGWWDDSAWHVLANWTAAAQRQEKSWTIELALDCKSFGIDARPGGLCRFNACRFRLGSAQQEFSAWGFDAVSRQKAMTAWGHMIFGAEGETQRGFRVTQADVARLYPDLGDRVLEVPTEQGFTVISADGEHTTSFAALAAEALAALDEQRKRAAEALALPAAAALTGEMGPLEGQAAQLARTAFAGQLTLGAYDRLADRVAELGALLDDLAARGRLLALVEQAHAKE